MRSFNQSVVAKFIEETSESVNENVEIIGLNLERPISFESLFLHFVGSMQFLNGSLKSPVNYFSESCITFYNRFVHTRRHLANSELIFAKGVLRMIISTPSTSLRIRNCRQKTPLQSTKGRGDYRTKIISEHQLRVGAEGKIKPHICRPRGIPWYGRRR